MDLVREWYRLTMNGRGRACSRQAPRPQKRQAPRAVFSQVQQSKVPSVYTAARLPLSRVRGSGPEDVELPTSDFVG